VNYGVYLFADKGMVVQDAFLTLLAALVSLAGYLLDPQKLYHTE
jgi:hypothetical protein